VRHVNEPAELADALEVARREAVAAFGDGTVYVEKLVTGARHVEVQLLGDRAGGLAVLGDRDCSIQRRHQKLVEESPAPNLTAETRAGLADDARRIGSAVAFHNAATVEFLVDGEGNRWFLEMNTRLQVEHGVTELVTGLDIVAWQLRVAAGERLPVEVLDASPRGHAIQVRVYAEDPWSGFAPAAGSIGAWRMPSGPGTRVDAGVEADTELPTAYDPLLAKILVHASDRDAAVSRLRRALEESVVSGVPTTLGFHRWLVDQPAFVNGQCDTTFVADVWATGTPFSAELRAVAAAAVAAVRAEAPRLAAGAVAAGSPGGSDGLSPWMRLGREEAVDRG
jgi:acetyl/propionyl-CoA carboxylase alpha subunit